MNGVVGRRAAGWTVVVVLLASWRASFALFTGDVDMVTEGEPPLITVCWSNPTADNQAARDEMRRSVEGSWQRWARVNFVAFDDCALVADTGERRIEVEMRAATYGGQCPFDPAQPSRSSCWIGTGDFDDGNLARHQYVVQHEVGHALGYYHEEERLDYDVDAYWTGAIPNDGCMKQYWCAQDNPNASDPCLNPTSLGGYDPSGIMSYCQGTENLSPNDIYGHQTLYGLRVSDSIATPRGNCLSVNHDDSNLAFTWDCDEADGQRWKAVTADGHIRFQGTPPPTLGCSCDPVDPSRCLGFESTTNGTVIESVSCSSVHVATFSLEDMEIRGYGAKCLEGVDGGQLTLSTCDGGPDQRWAIATTGEIRPAPDSDRCVTVQAGATDNGTPIMLGPCTGGPEQRFIFADRHIFFGDRCLDVQAWLDSQYWPNGDLGTEAAPNVPTDGAGLQLWECLEPQINQQFWLTGALRAGGKCVDVPNGSLENGTTLQVWDCLGNENQTWDIHF